MITLHPDMASNNGSSIAIVCIDAETGQRITEISRAGVVPSIGDTVVLYRPDPKPPVQRQQQLMYEPRDWTVLHQPPLDWPYTSSQATVVKRVFNVGVMSDGATMYVCELHLQRAIDAVV